MLDDAPIGETLEQRLARLRLTPAAGPRASDAPGETLEQRLARLKAQSTSAPGASPAHDKPLLERTWDAAKGFATQAVHHPIDTGVQVAKGLGQNVADAAMMSSDFYGQRTGRMLTTPEGRSRVAGAVGIALTPVLGTGGGVVVDAGINALIGAAQTPDDPAVGALLGGAVPVAGKVIGGAARGVRRAVSPLDGLTLDGAATDALDAAQPRGIPTREPVVTPGSDVARAVDLLNGSNTTASGIAPPLNPKSRLPKGTTRTMPDTDYPMLQDAGGRAALDKLRAELDARAAAQSVADREVPKLAAAAVEAAPRGPVAPTAGAMPDGFAMPDLGTPADIAAYLASARKELPQRGTRRPADVAASLAEEDAAAQAAATLRGVEMTKRAADDVTVPPNPTPAPPASGMFPDGYSTQADPALLPKRSATPDVRGGPDRFATGALTPVAGAQPQRQTRNVSAKEPPMPVPVGPEMPELAAPMVKAAERVTPDPLPMPAPIESAPHPVAPPALPDGMPAAPTPVEPMAAPAARAAEAAPPAPEPVSPTAQYPGMQPAKDVYLNWRTATDPSAPLGRSTAARMEQAVTSQAEQLKAARGYVPLDAQMETALKSDAIKSITDNPLLVDSKKLRGLSGMQVVATKNLLQENTRMQEVISRELMSGSLNEADTALAYTRLEQLNQSTNELLSTVVGESARMGRDLGALRVMSKLSTDPDVWLVHAKRALGDHPMTDDIMNTVRRYAKEAADACGLG